MGSKEPVSSSYAGSNKSVALNGVALLAALFLEMMIRRYFTVVKPTTAHDGKVCMEKIKPELTQIMCFTEPDRNLAKASHVPGSILIVPKPVDWLIE